MRVLFVAILTLLVYAARADSLADLRLKLQTIKPGSPYSAKIELRSTSTTDDDGDQVKATRMASIEAMHDATGIHLNWNSALLDKARQQKANAARDPDAPKNGELSIFDANAALDLLDAAPDLLSFLEGATLVDSRSDTYESKSTTVLTLKPRLTMARKERKRMKKFEYTARLWLDAEGWPVAIESQQHIKFSMMLMSFISDTKEKRVYSHVHDRIFITSSSRDVAFDGFGQKTEEHVTTSVAALAHSGSTK